MDFAEGMNEKQDDCARRGGLGRDGAAQSRPALRAMVHVFVPESPRKFSSAL